MAKLPDRTCPLGYTLAECERIVGSYRYDNFRLWMRGQTATFCDGQVYDPSTGEYRKDTCWKAPHGFVIYEHDLQRYLDGRPIVD